MHVCIRKIGYTGTVDSSQPPVCHWSVKGEPNVWQHECRALRTGDHMNSQRCTFEPIAPPSPTP